MRAGRLRDRVAFHRLEGSADAYGRATTGYAATPFLTVWGDLRIERGRERIEAGRLESATAATLMIRRSTAAEGVTAADKAVIDGVDWQVRSVDRVDRRGSVLQLVLERTPAQG